MKEARTAGRINGILIASGAWHDIDFARLELLKLLAEFDRVRIRVFEDYENLDALAEADFIVSYTCNVVPSLTAQEALREWVQAGGRWYALHGTNAIIRLMSDGIFETPDWAPCLWIRWVPCSGPTTRLSPIKCPSPIPTTPWSPAWPISRPPMSST